MTRALVLAFGLAAATLGCGGDDYGGGAGGAGTGAGAGGASGMGGIGGAGGAGGAGGVAAGKFGATCNLDTDCTDPMALCGDSFDRGGKMCTIHCTLSTDCPNGSMGPKCNMKGQCRP